MSNPTGQYIQLHFNENLSEDISKRELRSRPRAFHDDGHMTPVSDAWLIENDNIYPVHTPIVDGEAVDKPVGEWTVLADKVLKTQWLVVPKSYNPIYQNLVTKEESEWVYTDTTVDKNKVVDIPLEEVKSRMLETLASVRYQHEVGGMNYGQLQIHTDRDSQAKLTSNFVAIIAGLLTSDVKWKTFSGFEVFNTTDFQTMAATALEFVQACYDRESVVINQINAATTYEELVTAYAEIGVGYPATAIYSGE